MKRALILLAFVFCATSVFAQQSGYGGDGKASSSASVSSFIRLYETAPGAATTALAGAGAGSVDNGAHLVKVTCYTPGGETTGGTASNSTTVADKTTNGKIAISAIPTCSPVATGRKVYMTAAGGSSYFLLSNGTIADNTTTTLTANDADATLTASTALPTSNTALDTRFTVGQSAITLGIPLTGTTSVLGAGNYVNLASTSTLAASNTQTVLNVATSGANATSTQTTYGAQFANTHTGTGSTNVALYATASGGATANYAGIFAAGNVGIGTATPVYLLDIKGNGRVTNLVSSTANVAVYLGVSNGGNSSLYFGTESTAGGQIFTGTSSYAATIGNGNNAPFEIATNSTVRVSISGAGIASFLQPIIQSGTPQTLTGSGAINLTTYSTLLDTTGGGTDTLAAGSEGQYKFIRMKTDSGTDAVVTVTNLQGGTTITFNDAGDFVLLFYQDAKWHIIVNSGCAVA